MFVFDMVLFVSLIWCTTAFTLVKINFQEINITL